jgi:hypothetical protein
MSWEVRPEPAGRAAQLWEAQREAQLPVLAALFAGLEAAGEVRRVDGPSPMWAPSAPTSSSERRRLRLYFARSMVRATARWAKHVLSFEGWLDYIVRKASRHSGERIELSARERRWPLVFLWRRAFRYLRSKDGRGVGP